MIAAPARLVRARPVGVRIARADDRLVLIALVAVVLLVTALPDLIARLSAPPDRVFMGIVLNVPDTAQYLSWARESSRAVLIENRLTPERGEPVFFNLFWLGVGRLAAGLGLGLAETLQLVRPLAGAGYLLATYWLAGLLTRDRLERWTAFLVAGLGGGLGWLLVLGKQFTGGDVLFPLDLYVNESNTVLSVMAFPLASASALLLLLALGLAALALERGDLRPALAAGASALVLGLMHGYDLLIVYAVVGATALALAARSRERIRPLLIAALVCGPSAPAAAYLAYLTSASPIWRGVLAQYGNAGVYTPSPPHLLILIGLPLWVALLGLPAAWRRGPRAFVRTAGPRDLLLASWLVVGFLLLYIPTDFQIKMLAAWQVPVAIVAARLLARSVGRRLGARPSTLAALLVLATLPVNLYLVSWRVVELGRHDYPYYLHRDEVAALAWLAENSRPEEVVLSSLTIGQYLPGVAGNSAFLAHWAQTLDFFEKRRLVGEFFAAQTPEATRLETLRRYGVRYVFYAQPEREIGRFDPASSPHLRPAFISPSASVYRVVDR
jgi:hypothetical protein